jgi:hypothetical protein
MIWVVLILFWIDYSEDMPTLLGELRAQADARTYFLASKKMQ